MTVLMSVLSLILAWTRFFSLVTPFYGLIAGLCRGCSVASASQVRLLTSAATVRHVRFFPCRDIVAALAGAAVQGHILIRVDSCPFVVEGVLLFLNAGWQRGCYAGARMGRAEIVVCNVAVERWRDAVCSHAEADVLSRVRRSPGAWPDFSSMIF